MTTDESYLTVRARFYGLLEEEGAPDAALDALLAATRSRAAGLWRRTSGGLSLIGFRAAAEMADDVKTEFVSATTEVGLDRTGLSVVAAAVSGEPRSGYLDADVRRSDADSSSRWLARFGAIQSLAVPIRAAGESYGVLAISSAHRIEEGDPVWVLMTRLATALAPILQERE